MTTIVGLVKVAIHNKTARLNRENERRKEEEELRNREERARLRKKEQARVDALEKDAEAWLKSQQIRSYIEAVRKEGMERNGAFISERELDEWLVWAAQQADRLDPLIESPASILDKPSEHQHSWQRDY